MYNIFYRKGRDGITYYSIYNKNILILLTKQRQLLKDYLK